jgi:hypothetical protein
MDEDAKRGLEQVVLASLRRAIESAGGRGGGDQLHPHRWRAAAGGERFSPARYSPATGTYAVPGYDRKGERVQVPFVEPEQIAPVTDMVQKQAEEPRRRDASRLAQAAQPVPSKRRHDFRVSVKDNQLTATLNGKRVAGGRIDDKVGVATEENYSEDPAYYYVTLWIDGRHEVTHDPGAISAFREVGYQRKGGNL